MTDEDLMQATLIALTQQNVVGREDTRPARVNDFNGICLEGYVCLWEDVYGTYRGA